MGTKPQPTILIVDDSSLSRKSIESVLIDGNYRLRFAGDGFEALQIASNDPPDLILLDVMMPGIDGFEVCRRIRASAMLEAVPVIMITAMDDRTSRLKGIEAGADDFISKPFDRTLLKSRVQTIIRLNRYRRLVKERARFEWVIEHANDGYVILSQQDEVQYINARGRAMLGIADETGVTGAAFHALLCDLYICEPKDLWENWPRTIIANPNAARFIIQPESPEMHSKWIQVSCLDVPGSENESIVLILKDVSTIINEQRLAWSFHGMMSHKLRTPLNIIKSSLELFNIEELSETNAGIFSMFRDGVRRLDDDLGEVLEFIDAPMHTGALEHITIHAMKNMIRQAAASLEIRQPAIIVQDLDDTVPFPFSKKAFRSITMELLGNAKKFHPRHAPEITIDFSRESSRLGLRFSDDGIHISDDTLEKAWMPYYQGEKYFTGQLKGMGLGLSMVASLVWEVNGSFKLRNRPGKSGVEVFLSLPAQ